VKNALLSLSFTLLVFSAPCLPSALAQDYNQWNLPEGAKLRLGKGEINEIQYSPNGANIAVATSIGIWVYDCETSKELALLTNHTGSVESVGFSPDGRTLASGGSDVRLWDFTSGRQLRTLIGHAGVVNCIAFSPDGQTIVSGSADKTIRLWDVATGRHLRTLAEHTGSVKSVAFSPDGQTIVSGGFGNTMRLWDVDKGKLRKTFSWLWNDGTSVTFSPNGRIIASTSRFNNEILIWNTSTDKDRHGPARILEGHTGDVQCVAFRPDGQTLASASSDNVSGLPRCKTVMSLRTPSAKSIICLVFRSSSCTLFRTRS